MVHYVDIHKIRSYINMYIVYDFHIIGCEDACNRPFCFLEVFQGNYEIAREKRSFLEEKSLLDYCFDLKDSELGQWIQQKRLQNQ